MHNFVNYFHKFEKHDFSYLKIFLRISSFVLTNLIDMDDCGRKRVRFFFFVYHKPDVRIHITLDTSFYRGKNIYLCVGPVNRKKYNIK